MSKDIRGKLPLEAVYLGSLPLEAVYLRSLPLDAVYLGTVPLKTNIFPIYPYTLTQPFSHLIQVEGDDYIRYGISL